MAVFISKSPLFDVYTFLLVLGFMVVVYVATAVAHEVSGVARGEE